MVAIITELLVLAKCIIYAWSWRQWGLVVKQASLLDYINRAYENDGVLAETNPALEIHVRYCGVLKKIHACTSALYIA